MRSRARNEIPGTTSLTSWRLIAEFRSAALEHGESDASAHATSADSASSRKGSAIKIGAIKAAVALRPRQ